MPRPPPIVPCKSVMRVLRILFALSFSEDETDKVQAMHNKQIRGKDPCHTHLVSLAEMAAETLHLGLAIQSSIFMSQLIHVMNLANHFKKKRDYFLENDIRLIGNC